MRRLAEAGQRHKWSTGFRLARLEKRIREIRCTTNSQLDEYVAHLAGQNSLTAHDDRV